jgi:glycosyltransferase involved in cell wall biosynthesis
MVLPREMKVLYRIPYPYFFSQHDAVGGHVAHSLGIVGGLVENGHEVTVLAHEGKEQFEASGADFVQVKGEGTGPLWRQGWLYWFFQRSREMAERRSFDFTYTRYSASAAPHLWWTYSREAEPGILEINSLGSQRVAIPFLNWLEARALRESSMSVVVSDALKKWIEQNFGSDVASGIQVVPNGVSRDRFRSVPEGREKGPFRCAFAGLVKPDYGLEGLVDAARSLPEGEFYFHVFGAGPFEPELRDYASGVKNFVFEGEIPFEEVPDRLHTMDCLVYTTSSKWSFQSPTKLFEYMAIGRPIVAARTLQTKKVLEDGRLGRLFELESSASLCEAVLEVRDAYNVALDRAESAQQKAHEKHRWKFKSQRIVESVGDNI